MRREEERRIAEGEGKRGGMGGGLHEEGGETRRGMREDMRVSMREGGRERGKDGKLRGGGGWREQSRDQ